MVSGLLMCFKKDSSLYIVHTCVVVSLLSYVEEDYHQQNNIKQTLVQFQHQI